MIDWTSWSIKKSIDLLLENFNAEWHMQVTESTENWFFEEYMKAVINWIWTSNEKEIRNNHNDLKKFFQDNHDLTNSYKQTPHLFKKRLFWEKLYVISNLLEVFLRSDLEAKTANLIMTAKPESERLRNILLVLNNLSKITAFEELHQKIQDTSLLKEDLWILISHNLIKQYHEEGGAYALTSSWLYRINKIKSDILKQ